jgi:hypothetical protein
MTKCGIHVFDIFLIMINFNYVFSHVTWFNHVYSYRTKLCHEIHKYVTKAHGWLQKHV